MCFWRNSLDRGSLAEKGKNLILVADAGNMVTKVPSSIPVLFYFFAQFLVVALLI